MLSRLLERNRRRNQKAHSEQLEPRLLMAAHDVTTGMNFSSIQAAVNAANPGDTINVDVGTYNEQVTINKTLTLDGAKAGTDATDSSRGLGESIIRGSTISPGVQSTGINITANNVTVDGFTIQDNTSSGNLGAGVVFSPGITGTHFFNNIVKNNVTGLYLANSDPNQPALIEHNLFDSNNNPGVNNGRGIYTDGGVSGGLLSGVVIDSNTFTNNVGDGTGAPNAEAAIGLEAQTAGKQFNITITNNVMNNNGKGVLLINATNVTFMHNVVTGSTDTVSAAVRLEGGNDGVDIECNTIEKNLGAGIQLSPRFTGPDANVTVNENNIVGNATGGLIVDDNGYANSPLDATNNYWGSTDGPSGNFGGSGDSVVAGAGVTITVVPFLTAPSDCAPDIHQSPRELLMGVITDVTNVRNSASGDTGKQLADVLKKLWDANSDSRWLDKNHLSRKGADTFDRIHDVVHALRDLVKNKKNTVPASFIQDVLGRLVKITQSIVDIALFDASGGNEKKYHDALQELDRAQDALDDNKLDAVFDHLKKAWQKAQDALK